MTVKRFAWLHPDAARVAEEMGETMFAVLKPWHEEGKRRVRDQLKEERAKARKEKAEAPDEMFLNEASFLVLPEAIAHVRGGSSLPFNARRLFYAVRDRIQEHTTREFHPDTGYDYFRDTILQDYQREHSKIEGLYYDPRGRLHEPHDGRSVDMGTREVEAFRFPPHVYNKILYVEKKGQFPLLDSAKLMERYDMAIMTGEGFATEAARTLLEQADKEQKMQIFVLHDADPSGYDIARTVREETDRMPGYSVEVINLGLTVQQAVERGLEPERFTRKKWLKKFFDRLAEDGDELAFEHFFGREEAVVKNGKEKTVWVGCERFELDKMTAPQTIALVEAGLKAEGVLGKVVPPEDELPDHAERRYRSAHGGWVEEVLDEVVGLPDLKRKLADEFIEKYKLGNSERYIRARFKKDDALSWRKALDAVLQDIHDAKLRDALKDAVRKAAREALSEDGDE